MVHIVMEDRLSVEQLNWLREQRQKGKIKGWLVDPIWSSYGQERSPNDEGVAPVLRLTIELVPQPCMYNNLRNKMTRAAWDKLHKEVYAQYHYQCGICQVSNVKLHCA